MSCLVAFSSKRDRPDCDLKGFNRAPFINARATDFGGPEYFRLFELERRLFVSISGPIYLLHEVAGV